MYVAEGQLLAPVCKPEQAKKSFETALRLELCYQVARGGYAEVDDVLWERDVR